MTRTINILPEGLANKIAAGEVVQRPASAVKELLENSIDAGATTLTVIIKDAGRKLIHIIDDGRGMSPEDAVLAFERHATSKIAAYEDLERLETLGFRGEALASIAAVSHVEMKTRRSESEVGTKVRIEGGKVVGVTEEATNVGTSISVRNLFYNTPGRRNFLKSNTTEFKHIVDAVTRIGISHPEITLRFTSDDETIFNLRAASGHERIREIFGNALSDSLLIFEEKGELGTLSGFLSKPEFARKTRTEQYLFLNNRFIVNKSINHAVFQAYEHLLEKGSFPLFIVFLTIDPARVDVNVHPSKMEVKFADDSSVYRFVLSSVRKALSGYDLIPIAGMRQTVDNTSSSDLYLKTGSGPSSQRASSWEELLRPDSPSRAARGANIFGNATPGSDSRSTSSELDEVFQRNAARSDRAAASGSPSAPPTLPADAVIWQIHNKYIFVPIDSGIMIVDQHAAHERVLYERTIERFQRMNAKSQQLLFPQTIEMKPGDAALVQQLQPLLEGLGFSLKMFGKTTVIVDGVPIDVKPGAEGTILQEVIDLFKEDEHEIKLEPRERLAKSFSCKAAIKAGDPLKNSEMRSLLDQLFATEIPYSCPHGRPVIVKLLLTELDRRFGRPG